MHVPPERAAEIEAFIAKIEMEICAPFAAETGRFPSSKNLLRRYRSCVESFRASWFTQPSSFCAAHNELCVAADLLGPRPSAVVSTLDYEPLVPGTDLRLDFRVHLPGGVMEWVEVKTIIPTDKDDWEKYEAAKESGRFPTNVQVLLDQQYLGGEIWHDSYSARTHLLDCALATEKKIEECRIDPYSTPCTLVICSSGYKLPREEVLNFAHLLRLGLT